MAKRSNYSMSSKYKGWLRFTKDMFVAFMKEQKNKGETEYENMTLTEFMNDVINAYKKRKDRYVVYFGYFHADKEHKRPVYIGSTIQFPYVRWYWNRRHGKKLDFEIKFRFDNSDDMLVKKYEMIDKYWPELNRITTRKPSLNCHISAEELEKRKGNPEWCQCCFRRRARPGYKFCYWCGRKKNEKVEKEISDKH